MRDTKSHGIAAGTTVVGLDGSKPSEAALKWSVDQALVDHRPLTLVCAEGPTLGRDGAVLLKRARDEVARRSPVVEVQELLAVDDPRELLLELSTSAQVVVVGSRGRGPVRSLLLGSVGVALTRHASCPVVVLRPGNPGLVRNGVLVGVDGTERSQDAIEFGFLHASQHHLPLTVLHTYVDSIAAAAPLGFTAPGVDLMPVDLEEERSVLAASVAGMQEKYPDVRVRTELAQGLPSTHLLQEASRMNLVVVGGHRGGTAAEMLLRSVAVTVVEHATCPVAVVPARRTT